VCKSFSSQLFVRCNGVILHINLSGFDAGLQFSINTTNDEERNYLFSGSSLSLGEISEIGKSLPMPVGRKYALNFALADDTHIDGKRLRELFNPDKFMCKITPLHRTNSCDENDLPENR